VTSSGSLFAYDPSVSAAVSPTAAQTPAGSYVEAAALLTATGSSSSSVTDSTWDVVSGGSIPLNINDATTVGSTTTNTSYVYGNLLFGGTAPIEQITTPASGGATVRYLVSNQTGVQGVYSSSGALQELALYSLYGIQTIMSGTKVTPFGYQGSYTDSTGLIYLISRYFDPATDQFLSIDPDIANTDQPYVYAGDNPLNSCDPLGEDPALKGPASENPDQTVPAPVVMTLGLPVSVPAGEAVTILLPSVTGKVTIGASGPGVIVLTGTPKDPILGTAEPDVAVVSVVAKPEQRKQIVDGQTVKAGSTEIVLIVLPSPLISGPDEEKEDPDDNQQDIEEEPDANDADYTTSAVVQFGIEWTSYSKVAYVNGRKVT
jgi:RHS repeat-associated protein